MTQLESIQLANFEQTCTLANLVLLEQALADCELTPEARKLVEQLPENIEHLAGCLRELQKLKGKAAA